MARLWWRRRARYEAPPRHLGSKIADLYERPHSHRCSACDAPWSHISGDCVFDEHDREMRGQPFWGLCHECRRYRSLYFPLYLEVVGADRGRADQLRNWAIEIRREKRAGLVLALFLGVVSGAAAAVAIVLPGGVLLGLLVAWVGFLTSPFVVPLVARMVEAANKARAAWRTRRLNRSPQ